MVCSLAGVTLTSRSTYLVLHCLDSECACITAHARLIPQAVKLPNTSQTSIVFGLHLSMYTVGRGLVNKVA